MPNYMHQTFVDETKDGNGYGGGNSYGNNNYNNSGGGSSAPSDDDIPFD